MCDSSTQSSKELSGGACKAQSDRKDTDKATESESVVSSTPTETDDPKSRKRSAGDVDVSQVHSANAWENADMGGDDRKQKFLKLMGAGKKSHSGKIVIGESNTSTGSVPDSSSKKLSEDLEQQYTHSLEHKLMGIKRHRGLGFHEEPKSQVEEPATDAVITKDEELNIVASAAARSEGDNANVTNEMAQPQKDDEKSENSNKFAKMGFVKASS